MKKFRFSDSQIVEILNESEGGILIADILLIHDIGQGTGYKWRSNEMRLRHSISST